MATTKDGNDDGPTATAASRMIDFLTASRGLKTQLRTGWVRQEANSKIESIADHSWRITLMAMVAGFHVQDESNKKRDSDGVAKTSVDTNKCVQMALVHDLAEATVGDGSFPEQVRGKQIKFGDK